MVAASATRIPAITMQRFMASLQVVAGSARPHELVIGRVRASGSHSFREHGAFGNRLDRRAWLQEFPVPSAGRSDGAIPLTGEAHFPPAAESPVRLDQAKHDVALRNGQDVLLLSERALEQEDRREIDGALAVLFIDDFDRSLRGLDAVRQPSGLLLEAHEAD